MFKERREVHDAPRRLGERAGEIRTSWVEPFFSLNAGGASTSAIPNSPNSAARLLSCVLQMSEVLPSLVPAIILQHRDLRGRERGTTHLNACSSLDVVISCPPRQLARFPSSAVVLEGVP